MVAGETVMVVKSRALRQKRSGMATLVSYVDTDRFKTLGYAVETWVVDFENNQRQSARMLVAEEDLTKNGEGGVIALNWG